MDLNKAQKQMIKTYFVTRIQHTISMVIMFGSGPALLLLVLGALPYFGVDESSSLAPALGWSSVIGGYIGGFIITLTLNLRGWGDTMRVDRWSNIFTDYVKNKE